MSDTPREALDAVIDRVTADLHVSGMMRHVIEQEVIQLVITELEAADNLMHLPVFRGAGEIAAAHELLHEHLGAWRKELA